MGVKIPEPFLRNGNIGKKKPPPSVSNNRGTFEWGPKNGKKTGFPLFKWGKKGLIGGVQNSRWGGKKTRFSKMGGSKMTWFPAGRFFFSRPQKLDFSGPGQNFSPPQTLPDPVLAKITKISKIPKIPEKSPKNGEKTLKKEPE